MEIRELAREAFPPSLREIPDPPARLWLCGTLPSASTKLLAVVGSRALSEYGRDMTFTLIRGLSGYPISIVSGLALGADAAAHRAALTAGLHTLAVPGSGLQDAVLAPRSNLTLAHDILAAGGALLSEHSPDHVPRPYDFPARNRIMAGLADAVLVIEAGEKSGTLITARLAAEYNRDLLCVPHRATDPHGFGAHLFIRLGAALVTESAHILEALGIPQQPSVRSPLMLPDAEARLYALLDRPLTKGELLASANLPRATVLEALVMLDLKGLIREKLGRFERVS